MALHLNDILTDLVQRDGSDLHLKVGQPPFFRIYGRLTRTDYPTLTPELIRELIYAILSEEQIQRLERQRELDMAYELSGVSRFRVNLFHQQGNLGGVFRVIPSRVRTIDDLGLPQVLKKIALLRRGLVLVTGPTGSGKTTTLAAMVDYINENRRAHIITIEEPIEYWHEDKVASITQREVGADTESFAEALRHVMRQNPDVILVGEMRDLETIALAITAAETGHLVFATLHTIDAPQTIDRIIDVFPTHQQQQIRMQLSVSLVGVISQRLLRRADGKGMVAAFEVLVGTSAARALIREGKTFQLPSVIQTGLRQGMMTLEQSLAQLVLQGLVTLDDAIAEANNPDYLQELVQAGKKGVASP